MGRSQKGNLCAKNLNSNVHVNWLHKIKRVNSMENSKKKLAEENLLRCTGCEGHPGRINEIDLGNLKEDRHKSENEDRKAGGYNSGHP
jgi:hypothetical protein